jgi:hypothetical protein
MMQKEGIWNPKVKYPVMFGSGDSQYFGMMATQDIGANQKIIKVTGRLAISTAKALRGPAIQDFYFELPGS